MGTQRRFPDEIVAAIRDGKILGIRAGTEPHRFIGIWAVVVEGRVFVRSWGIKPRSWYRTFLVEPEGAIRGGGGGGGRGGVGRGGAAGERWGSGSGGRGTGCGTARPRGRCGLARR